jgi:hypothetical protein
MPERDARLLVDEGRARFRPAMAKRRRHCFDVAERCRHCRPRLKSFLNRVRQTDNWIRLVGIEIASD